jgi:predicted RNase H-like nuclease (RuvC/YqgF family)
LPGAWVERTGKAALVFAAGKGAAANALSTPAVLLAEGVLHAMLVTRIKIAVGVLILAGMVGSTVFSQSRLSDKEKSADTPSSKGVQDRSTSSKLEKNKKYADPEMQALDTANKLLQEEIEDAKAKLEALQKKLDRLKVNSAAVPSENPEMLKLKAANRRLRLERNRLQEEVQLLEEDVHPYVQALRERAGSAGGYKDKGAPRYFDKDKGGPTSFKQKQ